MQRYVLVCLLSLVFGQCFAHAEDSRTTMLIKTQVEKAFPNLKVDTVTKSPVSGLYELTAGSSIAYVSANGRYLLTGDVLDLDQTPADRNVTEGTRRKQRVGLLGKLDNKEMIVYPAKGKEQGVVTVFTDPDCGYCRKLHEEVEKLTELGIKLKYVAFPRQGIGSPTYTKMEGVWCAGDQKIAMTEAMLGNSIEGTSCKHSIEAQMELGVKLGVSATPALVFPDGTLSRGYKPAEKLAQEALRHQGK